MNNKGSMNIVIGILVAIILIGGGLVFKFWLAPTIFLAQVDSAHEIIDKTYDADNALYNYEWFKSQYEKIDAAEKQIDNTHMEVDDYKDMYGDPTEWDWQTKQDYSQLRTTFLGQKNHYESLVADYNARSKMANRNIFQNGLPFDVDKKIW